MLEKLDTQADARADSRCGNNQVGNGGHGNVDLTTAQSENVGPGDIGNTGLGTVQCNTAQSESIGCGTRRFESSGFENIDLVTSQSERTNLVPSQPEKINPVTSQSETSNLANRNPPKPPKDSHVSLRTHFLESFARVIEKKGQRGGAFPKQGFKSVKHGRYSERSYTGKHGRSHTGKYGSGYTKKARLSISGKTRPGPLSRNPRRRLCYLPESEESNESDEGTASSQDNKTEANSLFLTKIDLPLGGSCDTHLTEPAPLTFLEMQASQCTDGTAGTALFLENSVVMDLEKGFREWRKRFGGVGSQSEAHTLIQSVDSPGSIDAHPLNQTKPDESTHCTKLELASRTQPIFDSLVCFLKNMHTKPHEASCADGHSTCDAVHFLVIHNINNWRTMHTATIICDGLQRLFRAVVQSVGWQQGSSGQFKHGLVWHMLAGALNPWQFVSLFGCEDLFDERLKSAVWPEFRRVFPTAVVRTREELWFYTMHPDQIPKKLEGGIQQFVHNVQHPDLVSDVQQLCPELVANLDYLQECGTPLKAMTETHQVAMVWYI